MSLLAEVLSSADKIDLEEINTKIPELAFVVENYKNEVTKHLDKVYVKFSERPKHNQKLLHKLVKLHEETTNFEKSIQQVTKKDLVKAEKQLEDHVIALKRSKKTITIVEHVLKVHEGLIDIKTLQKEGFYLKCMEEIKKVKEFANNIPESNNLDCLQQLKLSVITQENVLIDDMSSAFKKHVILETNEKSRKLQIMEGNDLQQVLSGLYLYSTSVPYLNDITRFVWYNIFVPIVDNSTNIKVHKQNNFNTLELVIVEEKNQSYIKVFSDIKEVLQFLMEYFNFPISNMMSSLGYIGKDVRDNLSELLIKNCLEKTIPSTTEGLQVYKKVIEDTEDLEKYLVKAEIFTKDTISILDYANNIDILFINKRCQDYLKAAEALMRKDLHDMVEVGTPYDSLRPLESTTEFPRSFISKNVLELLDLIENILEQIISASDVCGGRLLYTVKNIIEKYGIYVPNYHKKFLQTIPQQVALFYNNCQYISYQLSKWNETYSKNIASILKICSNGFTEEGYQLQNIGFKMFVTYVESQIKQVGDIMRESGLESQQTLEKLEPITEKCLRQCLRQQELLKTVWHKVLPYTLYNKNIGIILNTLCNYLINSIVKFEDISSEVAEQLVEIIKIVVSRGPKLFIDPKEVSLFVDKWYKLNELVFVLSAGLVDINDRWADGKGPLALQFSPDELRQLIKALFQNTEQRATLLSRIHD